MKIEIIDLLSVLGVIFGWLLSELSKYFREIKGDKKLINIIIAELLFLRYEIYQFSSFARGAIDTYDRGRQLYGRLNKFQLLDGNKVNYINILYIAPQPKLRAS